RDRELAGGVLLAALLDRRLHHAAARSAPVDDVEVAVVGQQLQVTPDGLVRDAENVCELADADRPCRAQALHDLVMATDGERTSHAASGMAVAMWRNAGPHDKRATPRFTPEVIDARAARLTFGRNPARPAAVPARRPRT